MAAAVAAAYGTLDAPPRSSGSSSDGTSPDLEDKGIGLIRTLVPLPPVPESGAMQRNNAVLGHAF